MDTSALMSPVQADLRLFEELDRLLGEYEAVVPRAVLDELDSLSARGGEAGRAARVGRRLAERCALVSIDAGVADTTGPGDATTDDLGDTADDALVALVERGAVDAVCTNDAPLRERVLARGAQVIHLRGRNKLTRTHP